MNLDPDQEQIDPFKRRIVDNMVLRYLANIIVEMRETNGGKLVWSGQINRIHSVLPRKYMHEEGARPAVRDAFTELLVS